MKKMMPILLTGLMTSANAAIAATATFEDLPLAPESSGPGFTADGYWSSGGVSFFADWNETYNCCLSGFMYYSNRTDTSKVAFPDDNIATPGSGADGSATYAIAFGDGARAVFASPTALIGAQFTTTTITHDAILNGHSFADIDGYVFGGADGNAEDFLRLNVTGLDADNNPTGTIPVYLADYRFADNSLDYVLDDWMFVDLSALGVVSALEFSFTGTVFGGGFLSTPAYFAMDNLSTVPLPASVLLFAPALAGLGLVRRRTA